MTTAPSPIPMGRKDHGGGDAVGRPQTLGNQDLVIKRRERWLQGHGNNTSVGQPDSRSTPAAPEMPLGQIRLKEKGHAQGSWVQGTRGRQIRSQSE